MTLDDHGVKKPIVVIKLGSNALLDERGHLNTSFLQQVSEQITEAIKQGWQPVLVSSGAVACGMDSLGFHTSPSSIPDRQALAAVGQTALVAHWQAALGQHHLQAAQMLLTADDFTDRARYLNVTAAIRTLFSYGIIPLINENDTVAIKELTLGDNDYLSAVVASQLSAQKLIILTDIDGVYDDDPRTNTQAQLIPYIKSVTNAMLKKAGGAGKVGRGGMRSKLLAARLATGAGVETTIAEAQCSQVIVRALAAVGVDEQQAERVGTTVRAQKNKQGNGRRRWLALHRSAKGTVTVDDGATRALRQEGSSLLPVGIIAVDGRFSRGDTVAICDANGKEIARGLSGFAAEELSQIKGQRMEQARETLGHDLPKAAVHRDNLLIHDAL